MGDTEELGGNGFTQGCPRLQSGVYGGCSAARQSPYPTSPLTHAVLRPAREEHVQHYLDRNPGLRTTDWKLEVMSNAPRAIQDQVCTVCSAAQAVLYLAVRATLSMMEAYSGQLTSKAACKAWCRAHPASFTHLLTLPQHTPAAPTHCRPTPTRQVLLMEGPEDLPDLRHRLALVMDHDQVFAGWGAPLACAMWLAIFVVGMNVCWPLGRVVGDSPTHTPTHSTTNPYCAGC